MNHGLLLIRPQAQSDSVKHELAALNDKTRKQGLLLNEAEITMLVERRSEALRETRRIEFGQGPLPSLVDAFYQSPYLNQESYFETMAELQDIFYQLKEETGECIPDEDLIEAMRSLFDTQAHGSLEYLGGLPAEKIVESVRQNEMDANENWSEQSEYEKEEDEPEKKARYDEIDRVFEGGRKERPDNDYASNFYDEYNELYRTDFDFNSRIGGSLL